MYARGNLSLAIVSSILACAAGGVDAQDVERTRELPIAAAGSSTVSLEQVRLTNELLYSELENFVCTETIERYRGSMSAVAGVHIDTITSKLSFENGIEHYAEIRQNGRPRSQMSDFSGAWSESEYGTLLRQTELLLGLKAVPFRTDADFNGTPAVTYGFEVSEQESPWELTVDSQHYRIPFRTDVWVARSSGQILNIERTSTAIPLGTRISEIRWSVSLEPVELKGKSWLLPKIGEYSVSYADVNRREWNVMSFSDYRRYGSEVSLSFAAK